MLLAWILGFSLLGSLGAVGGAALLLAFPDDVRKRLVPALVAYAAGTLLGAAFLGMIPAAAADTPVRAVSAAVLAGIVLFFVLERLVLWRHGHEAGGSPNPAAPLILVGDAFHNFVDGVVIAGAFLGSTSLGISVALSTVAHEVPQELGEFMVYLRSGFTRRRALLLNSVTSMTSVVGAILGYFFLAEMHDVGPYLLTFAAAGFIYVALADLVPVQRGKTSLRLTIVDLVLVAAGIGVIALLARSH